MLYVGGLMVMRGRLNPGALVSFLLYQASLSAAFTVSKVYLYYICMHNASN